MVTIYTIGHSNHPPEKLLWLLSNAHIEKLVDVRSSPYSAFASYTNPRDLSNLLEKAFIQYEYLGNSLGGKPKQAEFYDDVSGKPDYDLIRSTQGFQDGIEELIRDARSSRTCIMCAEENPALCHRNLLVGAALRKQGITILHIRMTGKIQTDEDLLKEKAGVDDNQLVLPL